MKQRIGVVFPWLDWDHFPSRADAHVAHRVLSAWTAAWHPWLICQAEAIPEYVSPYQDAASLAQQLLLVPDLPDLISWRPGNSQASNVPGSVHIISVRDDRYEAVAASLQHAEQAPAKSYDVFMSLGYHYFQLQLLTRRMHGGSSTSESTLIHETIRAAKGWCSGDDQELQAGLQGAFAALMNERSHYYPVDAYFLECVFWESVSADYALRQLQCHPVPRNWWLSPAVLQAWKSDPQLESLRGVVQEQIAAKTLGLLGGEDEITESTLLPMQCLVDSMRRGREMALQTLGKRPSVFARPQFGVSPRTPDLLRHFRYEGIVMSPLGLGQWPRSTQSRTQWVSLSQQTLEAVGTTPIDPYNSATMFHLAHSIAESMEKDYVATVLFASHRREDQVVLHGPDTGATQARTEWLRDLKTGMEYGAVLGKFATVGDYVQKASPMGQRCDLKFDAYISPYLRSDVRGGVADPISRWTGFWKVHAKAVALSIFRGMAATLPQRREAPQESDDSDIASEADFAARLMAVTDPLPNGSGASCPGWLILNPCSANLRRRIRLADTAPLRSSPADSRRAVVPPSAQPPTSLTHPKGVGPEPRNSANDGILASSQGDPCEVVVDVPAFGYIWVPDIDRCTSPGEMKLPSMVDGLEIRNEFLRARIDRESGGLASLHDFRHRSNRASQRLVWISESEHRESNSSTSGDSMIAEAVEITRDNDVGASITSRGRLVSHSGRDCGRFLQEFTLNRGSRELWLRIEVEIAKSIQGDPWRNYLASRLAWRGESDRILRWVQDAIVESSVPRFESPLFFQMQMGESRTTFFSPGLPYHMRPEPFRIDTLLQVTGETAREFVVGLGIDSRSPWQTAIQQLAPSPPVWCTKPANMQGWFLQLDRRNVVICSTYPAKNSESQPTLRLQLAELDGLACQSKLSCWRTIRKACKVDADGVEIASCEILDGAARFFMRPYEWTEVELHW
jgi:alpha-mannosidase